MTDAPVSRGPDIDPGRDPRIVVLVEGPSDRAAVTTLLRRRDAAGIEVVAMGGITNLGRFLTLHSAGPFPGRIAGLYDEGEEKHVLGSLEKARKGSGFTRADAERHGFFVCVTDLEDEMIRAVGVEAVLGVVESQGELAAFGRLQRQPQWRQSDPGAQLHRFIGTRSGRKIRYGALLAEALGVVRLPRPLDSLLRHLGL